MDRGAAALQSCLKGLICLMAVPALAAEASPEPALPAAVSVAAARAAAPFATVGEVIITGADYQRALAAAMRKKYYHAKPPEGELAQFQRQVGDDVVNRVLLLAEARRRGVQPDRERIQAAVADYDRQYGASETWKTGRAKMLANVLPVLESESLLERFEKLVKAVPEPSDAVARDYYERHRDRFVEPEQVKLSLILLRVDPSASSAAWAGARAEAESIHRKLLAGADFAELARLHSADRTAARGGAMDYTHRGMLPEAVHGVIDPLAPGELSAPVRLLEGYVLIRLDGRKTAQQRGFTEVRERAGDLWQREEGETRWKQLIAELRQATPVRVDESHYAPLRGPSDKPRAG